MSGTDKNNEANYINNEAKVVVAVQQLPRKLEWHVIVSVYCSCV